MRVAEPNSLVARGISRHTTSQPTSIRDTQHTAARKDIPVSAMRCRLAACSSSVRRSSPSSPSLRNAHVRRPCHQSHVGKPEYLAREITNTWPRSCRPATSDSTTVCSRSLPVCQRRPVLYPLGIAANTIHQNCHADAINASYSTTEF